jgi:hypothetical protein
MTVKPLSPLYIWVHIIENEIWFYRKRDNSKMVAKLSTTINKIQRLPNSSNSKIINDFLLYMKGNGSSERHQNNNLNVMIEYAIFLGPNITFYNVNKKEQILSFLDTKIKDSVKDPEKRWITSWNHYLVRIKLFFRWLYNKYKEIDKEYWETSLKENLKILNTNFSFICYIFYHIITIFYLLVNNFKNNNKK